MVRGGPVGRVQVMGVGIWGKYYAEIYQESCSFLREYRDEGGNGVRQWGKPGYSLG